MPNFPKDFLLLIEYLKKLPGVGKRSAERFAFELTSWKSHELESFGALLKNLPDKITNCSNCGCLIEKNLDCYFCSKDRNQTLLCIIANPKDAFAIDQTNTYNGLYHVLGSLISPLEGKSVDALNLEKLIKRIQSLNIQEVILALDSTLEGDATSLYINEHLKKKQIRTSKLALGLPIGSNLEYIDPSTLSQALLGRQTF